MSVLKDAYRALRAAIYRSLCNCCGTPLNATCSAKHLIIIAPHPDDEAIGCAQLIAKTKEEGGHVSVVFLTNGEQAHCHCCNIELTEVARRRHMLSDQIDKQLLHVDNIVRMKWSDGKLPVEKSELEICASQLADHVRKLKEQYQDETSTLLAPHHEEGWSDHWSANQVAQQVAQRLNLPLLNYCVWLWLSMPYNKMWQCRWRNVHYVSGYITTKRQALIAYQETAPCGKPWVGLLPRVVWRAANSKREYYFCV